MQGVIFDIKHFAIHDGPGIRQTIFFKGCPLSCWWCHNPESRNIELLCEETTDMIDGVKVNSSNIQGNKYSIEEVVKEINKDVVFFEDSKGGVTLSGGEPLIQHEFVKKVLLECKRMEIHTCVDTTGNISSDVIIDISGVTDLFLYDLKHIDDSKHIKYTGVSNSRILRNLKLLDELKKDIWIRFPLIPGFNDDESDLLRMMELLSKLKHTYPISILPYHKIGSHKYRRYGIDYKMEGINEPTENQILRVHNMFTNAGFVSTVGG